MSHLFLLAIAYLLGGIPFGFLLVRWKTGKDVRSMGSGNIGATNVLRTTGRSIAGMTLLLDIAKGFAAVWIADRWTGGSAGWMSAAALAVIAGHAFPIFLKFKGGKAVASFLGAFLYLTPLPVVAVLIVFVVTVAFTRYISLGSVLAAGTFPLAVWMIDHPHPSILGSAVIAGIFIVWRHKSNLERLRGNENVFSSGARK